jgi:hypothetical protein
MLEVPRRNKIGCSPRLNKLQYIPGEYRKRAGEGVACLKEGTRSDDNMGQFCFIAEAWRVSELIRGFVASILLTWWICGWFRGIWLAGVLAWINITSSHDSLFPLPPQRTEVERIDRGARTAGNLLFHALFEVPEQQSLVICLMSISSSAELFLSAFLRPVPDCRTLSLISVTSSNFDDLNSECALLKITQ